jgi:hypothetical protein
MSTCRRWRSEAYAAFANRHEFTAQREARTNELVKELASMLHIFVPRLNTEHYATVFWPSIRTIIIEPALDLAHKLHLSVDKFNVEWTDFSRTPPRDRKMAPELFQPFDSMDLLKSKKLKPQDLEAAGLVTYIMDLTPQLSFQVVKADALAEAKVLCKARVLVAATKKGKGPFMPPELEDGQVATLLGWLADRLRRERKSRW